MIFRPLIIQYQNYVTSFKKGILQSYYGLPSLRNLMFIKPDRRLYYQDNTEAEFCLSHPDWSDIQNKPDASDHTHDDLAQVGHSHPATRIYLYQNFR